jgi:hypothetical protein
MGRAYARLPFSKQIFSLLRVAVCYSGFSLFLEDQTDAFTVLDGRLCSSLLGPSCCLPCPQTEWFYPDNFETITNAANWVNVVGMTCSMFLIISFTFLPVEKTHRHYLSVCLAIATVLMQVRTRDAYIIYLY